MARDPDAIVFAAGGAVWRRSPEGLIEVLLVHRPRYDDWSLPKGKLDEGETMRACAEREVLEETGLVCELGAELVDLTYRDHKDRPKVVRYWAMTVVGGTFVVNDEVDEVRWLPFAVAARDLTYPHDRAVLRALVQSLVDVDPS